MDNKEKDTKMNKEILYFIFVDAIRDATMMKSLKGEKKQYQDVAVFNAVVMEGKGILQLVNNVLNGKYTSSDDEEKCKQAFERDFLDVSKYVCSCIKEFRFGNAQKLINIMLKYVYIMTYSETSGVKKSYFQYCHCPMDSIMLKDAWNNRRVWSDRCSVKYKRDDFLMGWGQEEFETINGDKTLPKRYKAFQFAVDILANESGLSPLEYDYYIWGKNIQN